MDDYLRKLTMKYAAKASHRDIVLQKAQLTNTDSVPDGRFDKFDLELTLHKYEWTLNTFVYGNNFLGNDSFLLRYIGAQLKQYLFVVHEERLPPGKYATAILEIKVLIYQYIHLLYNIKEKLEIFLSWDEKTKKISNSIIEPNSVQVITNYLSSLYTKIKPYCDARNACVHNTYSLDYSPEKNVFSVSCFAFTMSEKRIEIEEQDRNSSFVECKLTVDEVTEVVSSVFLTLGNVLSFLADVRNISIEKLLNKFIRERNGQDVFEITF